MTVSETGRNLLVSLLLGGVLGLGYGFLRPLRRKGNTLADCLFLVAAGWAGVWFGFGICRGDLRIGYYFTAILGALLWDRGPGRLLFPAFEAVWHFWGGFWRQILWPLKKSLKKAKILFASVEKWVTIKWSKHWHHPANPGGSTHEKKQSPEKHQSHYPAKPSGIEDRADRAYHIVYRGSGSTASGAQRYSAGSAESEG